MFGLFCRGLHCAGCGKGLPLSLIILIVGIVAVRQPGFDAMVGGSIIEGSCIIGGSCVFAAVAGGVILTLLNRVGPKVVWVKWERGLTYSQIKYLESGDRRWLGLTGGILPELSEAPDETSGHTTKAIVLCNDR
jgi:hypothetical protein